MKPYFAMKKLLVVFSIVSLVLFPQSSLFAGTSLPVTKKMVTQISIPDPVGFPLQGELLSFRCGNRNYIVWQTPIFGGYAGQTVSRLYALKPDGSPAGVPWQTYAFDTDSSIVRFTGTCVGDRAVMTNHWENAMQRLAGDMVTSVTGEEGAGPMWQDDGKTAFHWYSTSDVPGGVAKNVYPFHQMHIRASHASLTGTIVKYGDKLYGSSVNMILGADGKSYAEYAPWFADFSKMVVPQGMQFEARFFRVDNGWLMIQRNVPADPSAIVKETSVQYWMHEDTSSVWHEVSAKIFAKAMEDGFSKACESASVNSVVTMQDGLYHRTITCTDSGEMTLNTPIRIHVAKTNDLYSSPRVYTTTNQFGMVGKQFVYVIRTGENKLQLWEATVK